MSFVKKKEHDAYKLDKERLNSDRKGSLSTACLLPLQYAEHSISCMFSIERIHNLREKIYASEDKTKKSVLKIYM